MVGKKAKDKEINAKWRLEQKEYQAVVEML